MFTFTTSRIFDASPEAVFATFATPERLKKWWGPDGFRNTFEKFEFKPNGQWRFVMHGPDGRDYLNEVIFLSIEPAVRIVLKHESQPHFILRISFDRVGSDTLVKWEQTFESEAVAISVKHIVEPANEQNLNRWQSELAVGTSGED